MMSEPQKRPRFSPSLGDEVTQGSDSISRNLANPELRHLVLALHIFLLLLFSEAE